MDNTIARKTIFSPEKKHRQFGIQTYLGCNFTRLRLINADYNLKVKVGFVFSNCTSKLRYLETWKDPKLGR